MATETSSPPDPVSVWVKAEFAPLGGIEPGKPNGDLRRILAPIIGQARVVALGEPEHGIHEFLDLRNRVVELLVTEMGVTAIAAETGYSESVAVDDYVLGRENPGPEDLRRVVASVFSWSGGTAYPENQALLSWLRTYNSRASVTRKVCFYGLDLTGGRGGRFVETHLAFDAALAYLAKVDAPQEQAFRGRLTSFLPRFSSEGYPSLSGPEQETLTSAIDDLSSLFQRRRAVWTEKTSTEAFERAAHQVTVVSQLNANFRAATAESNPQAQRESAMAENLGWVLDREGPKGRVFLYVANWHASKGPMVTDRWGSALGEYLRTLLGADYVSIAGTYAQNDDGSASSPSTAPEAGSVAALLSQLHVQRGILSLRHVPRDGPVADWFAVQRPLRAGRNDGLIVNKAFDAVVFVGTVHPATQPPA
ncbi:MAG TPA: erythromycin esterase family protein [Candidatus Polarisedimenticolaceae bacterium]|nr:erythromycin esterase family protein [Candidatus Polarisedimenticolaceae bacterium]